VPEFALVALSEEKNNNIRDAERERETERDEHIKRFRDGKNGDRATHKTRRRRKKKRTREREKETLGEGREKRKSRTT
jgi:hypothetical protein